MFNLDCWYFTTIFFQVLSKTLAKKPMFNICKTRYYFFPLSFFEVIVGDLKKEWIGQDAILEYVKKRPGYKHKLSKCSRVLECQHVVKGGKVVRTRTKKVGERNKGGTV